MKNSCLKKNGIQELKAIEVRETNGGHWALLVLGYYLLESAENWTSTKANLRAGAEAGIY